MPAFPPPRLGTESFFRTLRLRLTTAPSIHVSCAVCGGDRAEPAYRREHETGSCLGRLEVRLVLCPGCGFLYANPRPTPEAMARYYRESRHASGAVFRESGEGSRHGALTERRARFLGRWIEAEGRAGGVLLDVGCGRGDLLAALELDRWRCLGLEPSPDASEAARARGLEVVAEALERTSLAPASFDAVACISVLEHAGDPRASAEDLARLLKRGGLCFVEVPDSARPQAQVSEFYSFEHLSHFTRGTLVRLMLGCGFEPLFVERDDAFPALRACFRHVGVDAVRPGDRFDDRDELIAALASYRAERSELERGLRERLGPRAAAWRSAGKRVAIYGAGVHTRFLLELVDLGEAVACVLDGDARKQGGEFLGWPVHAPSAAAELALDAVVLSSRAYQEEMFRAVAPLAEEGVEIVRCYGEDES